MTTPFDFVNAVSQTKVNLMEDPQSEKEYVPFIVNRSLSYHQDTILYANEMNMRAGIPNKQQFAYLINTVRPRKRFAKWAKKASADADLQLVMDYYGYNINHAKAVLPLLNKQHLSEMRDKIKVE